jgi:hypothetical protein
MEEYSDSSTMPVMVTPLPPPPTTWSLQDKENKRRQYELVFLV